MSQNTYVDFITPFYSQQQSIVIGILFSLMIFGGFSLIAIGLKASLLVVSIRSWLEYDIEKFKKDLELNTCFTLKHSSINFFRYWISDFNTELIGYVFDSPANFNQKIKMSCYYSAYRDGKFKPSRPEDHDSLLLDILNSDEQLMKLINKTRIRMNATKIYFSTCTNPFEETKEKQYAWIIETPVWPIFINSKAQIEHVISIIERMANIIKATSGSIA